MFVDMIIHKKKCTDGRRQVGIYRLALDNTRDIKIAHLAMDKAKSQSSLYAFLKINIQSWTIQTPREVALVKKHVH